MSEPQACTPMEESLIGWVNTIHKVENWDRDWANGKVYLAILRKYRPDLIEDDSGYTIEDIFDHIEENLCLPILVDPRDITALENFSFVAQLKQYFESKDFLIDKEIPKRSIPKSYSDLDIKRPLCSRLFARKSVQDRIDELKSFDGITLSNSMPQVMDSVKTSEETKIENNSDTNPFGDSSDEIENDEIENDDIENVRRKKIDEHRLRVDQISNDVEITNTIDASGSLTSCNEGTINPFGEDEVEEDDKPNSTNPFGSDSEDENSKESDSEEQKENSTNPFGSGDENEVQCEDETPGNPFGDFEEENEDENNPFASKTPPKRPPPPKISPVKPVRKKKQAPPPPVESANRPKRPPPPKPKAKAAPGFGHPLIKRTVENDEESLKLEMEKIDQEIAELEKNATKLEDMLRFSNGDSSTGWKKDSDLMSEWMAIVKQRNELTRRDRELGYRLRLTRLEMKHAELEFEMRKILHKTPDTVTSEEKKREQEIMEELVTLVNKRDEMIETIELERQRLDNEESNNNTPLNIQSPAKVKKKRGVSIKKLKSFVKKKDKKPKDIPV